MAELVAPIIPDAQKNRSPDLLLEGFRTGLAGATQLAQLRRQSEHDVAQLALRERLAEKEHDLSAQRMSQDYELRNRQIDVQKSYYDGVLKNRNTGIDFNLQRQSLLDEVNQSAAKLKLNDPHFQTKEPIKFAQSVKDFEDMWRLSPLPEVKHAIAQYKSVAEEQKIPIKMGMVLKEGVWTGGDRKEVPILQIVKNLKDPETRDRMTEILAANGLMKVPKELEAMSGKWFGGLAKDKLKPTEIIDPRLNKAMEQSADLDTSRKESRVPSVMLPKSAGKGTAPTELTDPDLPVIEEPEPQASNSREPVFEPTKTEMYLGQAQIAIRQGAPMKEVAKRLQDLGIDPNQLWAT